CAWKEYDALGRVLREYGPVKTDAALWLGSGPWTQYTYDALGRMTNRARFSADGAGAGAGRTDYGLYADAYMPAAPVGTTETVYDEANRWRKLYRDGFDRIVRVDEPAPTTGTWRTDYGYDRLGNLTYVNKRNAAGGDGQVRTFTYDCRGKLLSAALPEFAGGVFHYLYDDGGNLLQKGLDSNGQQVYNESMSYDGLGRILTRSVNYGDGTVSTTYAYDVGAYAWGKPSSDVVTYPGEAGQVVSIARSYDYEWFGALKTKTETILLPSGVDAPDNPFRTRYEYGSAGQLTKVTYPSGVAKELSYRAGGGLSAVKVDGAPTFAGMTSAANGATEAVNYGTATGSVSSVRVYDPTRLWPVEMKVGPGVVAGTGLQEANVLFGLSYGYEDNGNVTQMNRYVQTTPGAGQLLRSCNYAYDTLNRLSEFTYDQTNHYHYAMDEYGNLLAEQKVSGGTGAPKGMAMPVDVTTNRLAGKPYDSLGNQVTTESGTATLNLAYWDQGHVARVWGGSTGKTYHYYYDAAGKRRLKLVRADGTQAVLGWTVSCYEGEDLACEQDQGDRVQPDAAYASKFLLTDHLGTTRAELRIDAAGLPAVTQSTDTMPYGEFITAQDYSTESLGFTGKQIAFENKLYYFSARDYGDISGRFYSCDPIYCSQKHLSEPQKYNLYSYTQGNPINRIDPDGQNWFKVKNKWEWHSGATYQGVYSGVTHILKMERTGQKTKGGADIFKLSLWGNSDPKKSKPITTSEIAFSGGRPDPNGKAYPSLPSGDYSINLNKRGDASTVSIMMANNELVLAPFHCGIQEIQRSINYNGELVSADGSWGELRVNLMQNGRGTKYYIHGKGGYFIGGNDECFDMTGGCIAEPHQFVLRAIFALDPNVVGEGKEKGQIAVSDKVETD
ncbi:MAG: RHS repeat-associated core domain-containing protein, partial [Acidobacteria bacterium]|nr:RHS repeat-associated core domain-containing protein [Acidobacteriota bacterium]